MIKKIESKDNKFYKKIKSLNKSSHRKKNNLFMVEGKKMFLEALKSHIQIECIIKRSRFNDDLLKNIDINIIELSDFLFDEITSMENDEGIITICYTNSESEIDTEENYLVLDGIKDPGNMGTIIRTAESFGYKNILLINNCVDTYNSKVLRATMGSIFRVNIVEITVDDLLFFKKNHRLLAMNLNNKSKSIYDMTDIGKHAIIIGNEANGISKDITNLADDNVIIPIDKNVESLNAAIAASITMFYFNLINIEKEKKGKK